MDVLESGDFGIFLKCVFKMEDSSISDKNNRYFTQQPVYVYGIFPVT
jgi:hypothetical protein